VIKVRCVCELNEGYSFTKWPKTISVTICLDGILEVRLSRKKALQPGAV